MDNGLNYFRVGDLVMVDGYPRNITCVGNTYLQVEIDGVDVACKIEDVKQIPVNHHFLLINGWKMGENFRGIYIPFTKGGFEVRMKNGGNFSLTYFGETIFHHLSSISQLQHLILEYLDGKDDDDGISIFKFNEE